MIDPKFSKRKSAIYVGVGIGKYDNEAFCSLPHAVPDVRVISEALTGFHYEVSVIEDVDRANAAVELTAKLPKDLFACGGSLIVLWSGHGEPTPEGKLHLVTKDGEPGEAPLITAEYIASLAARTGAGQVLLVLDTCYSGVGAIPAIDMADKVIRELPPNSDKVWIGVVASAMDYERARDGLFGSQLLKLLLEGPDDPELQLRWNSHSAGVRGDDLVDALIKEWKVAGQRPKHAAVGDPWIILPNPRYIPGTPERIVEHLLLAARGLDPGEEGFYFTGRVTQLNRIISWMQTGKPGIFVVTGPAGSGKSAIVGRVVSLSNPEERSRLLARAPLEHADPGEGSVHAHVHAHGETVERLCEVLDKQLIESGLLTKNTYGSRNRGELLGAIERQKIRPVIVVDGLDETGSEAWRITDEVIRLLGMSCLVLVSTRELPPRDGGHSMIQCLVPSEIINLGDETQRVEAQLDVHRYIEKRLDAVSSSMDTAQVSYAVLRIACKQEDGMFLLARIITSQLKNSPVDTSLPGWEGSLDRNIEEAFDRDISKIGEGRELSRARELLTALAWGYGSGLPDDIWPIMATAISSTEATYERSDVYWLLGQAGRHVVEGGKGGRAVYRLVHQRLGEHLHPPPKTASEFAAIEDLSSKIAPALVRHYFQYLNIGLSEKDHPYLKEYVWRHCSDAGEVGIAALRELVEYNRQSFEPDLAEALDHLGNRYNSLGRSSDAVILTEEAANLYSKLSKTNPAFEPDLAAVLNNLGNRYSDLSMGLKAVKPTEKSTKLYSKLVNTNPAFKPELAESLINLGNRYSSLNMSLEAVRPTEKAAKLFSKLASKNPVFMPNLAKAQNNLGNFYGSLGKNLEAAKSTEKAAKLFSQLVNINPAFLSDLTKTQISLSNINGRLGKSLEAVMRPENATKLFSRQVNINPAFLPDLPKTQISLSNINGSLVKNLEAVMRPVNTAKLFSKQINIQPNFITDLTKTQINFDKNYESLSKSIGAVMQPKNVEKPYSKQLSTSLSLKPSLTESLINFDNCYNSLDMSVEIIKPTERAVMLSSKQATEITDLNIKPGESVKVENKATDDKLMVDTEK